MALDRTNDSELVPVCIPLTQNQTAIIDLQDYDRISRFRWYVSFNGKRRYAERREYSEGLSRRISMHRELLNAPKGMDVDHINWDGLDNRRSNLRLATRSQNMANQPRQTRGSSQFKGVYFDRCYGKWKAMICVHRKKIHLGRFDVEELAAKAYDRAAITFFGEFSYVNFKPMQGGQSQ